MHIIWFENINLMIKYIYKYYVYASLIPHSWSHFNYSPLNHCGSPMMYVYVVLFLCEIITKYGLGFIVSNSTFNNISIISWRSALLASSLAKGYDSCPLLSTLGGSRIHFEHSHFNISLVTATSTRIQSEDVLHGAHVIDEM